MNKMFIKKWLCLTLAVLMLASVMIATVSCSNNGDQPSNTPTDTTTAAPSGGDNTPAEAATSAAADTTTEVLVEDDLPELNFGNTTFHFLAWKQGVQEYYAKEQTGDAVNDAIYYRNLEVENRLGVKLEYTEIKGNSSAFRDYCQTVMTAVNAGDNSYDALACYLRSAGVLSLQHALVDLLEVDHINFDQPWWPSSLTELNTIDDKLYFMSGDIATSLLYQMMFVVYNNDLSEAQGLTNPQEIVLDGKWTQDYMFSLAANIYADLDGSGDKSEGDRYGLFAYQHPNLDIFYMGADMHYLEPTASGELALSDDVLSEKSYAIIDKLIALIYRSNDGYYTHKLTDSSTLMYGNSLLYNTTGQSLAQVFYNSDMNYSILPAPKYDEAQAKYLTPVAFTHSMYCIPISARDADMAGAVLECLASESYRTVTPALFESSFKYKYSKGEADSQIFELIRSGVVFDIGRPFFDELGGDDSSPIRIWRKQIETGSNFLSSTSKTYTKTWDKALKSINSSLVGN